MKAVIFYGGFLGRSGGAFMHARMTAGELVNRGWDVRVVTLDDLPALLRFLPHLVQKLVNALRFPTGFFYKGRVTQILYKRFVPAAADLLIFEDIYISWNTSSPSVTLLHAVWSDNLQAFDVSREQKKRLLDKEAASINSIEHPLITVSEPYRKFLLEEHFCEFELRRIDVVPLGIDLAESAFPKESRRAGNSIVYCGALEARKNVSLLLKVFHRLIAEDSSYSLTIIGDGPEQKILEEESRRMAINVTFLGRMDHSDALAELARHSIYVHTSRKESFSFVLLEAKLIGLTTIAFEGLQVPAEFIDVGVTSFEPDEWCHAILNSGRGHGRHKIDRLKYSPEAMVRSTLDLAFHKTANSLGS